MEAGCESEYVEYIKQGYGIDLRMPLSKKVEYLA